MSPEASSPPPSPPFGEERETESWAVSRFMGSMRATGFRGILTPLGRARETKPGARLSDLLYESHPEDGKSVREDELFF
jgi:hypothetical protein